MGDEGIILIARNLPSLPLLRSLNLEYNEIDREMVHAVTEGLRSLPLLTSLNLQRDW